MTKKIKAHPNVPEDLTKWPATIVLQEKMPADHDRAGQCRYGHTGLKGEGRFDWMILREPHPPQ